MKLTQIMEVKTLDDLKALNIGEVVVDISTRGGGLGFHRTDIAKLINVSEMDLPRKYGAGCNYLGGGVRGAIFASGYNKIITGRKAVMLDEIAKACIRVYEWIENTSTMNTEEIDGETNWDAMATNSARRAGTISAY